VSPSRNTPLRSTTPLAPFSAKRLARLAADGLLFPSSTFARAREPKDAPKPRRRQPAVPAAVRAALKARSGGGWCEIGMTGCTRAGTDPSHRITVKNGGRKGAAKARHDRLSNLLWACRPCHDWVTAHPKASKAEQVGWALEEWQEPTQCPVLRRGELVYLADDGDVIPFEEACA